MRHKLTKPGPGRPKGAQNKVGQDVRKMVSDALANAGGVTYLTQQAKKNPKAFLTLVGKLIPQKAELSGPDGAPIQHSGKLVHFTPAQMQEALRSALEKV